ESVESYYQCFDEHIDRQKEDDTEVDGNRRPNSQYNYMFVDNLHPSIKTGFLRLPEARDFQKKDLYELRELATRVEESVSHFTKPSNPKSTSNNSSKYDGNKPSKKFQKSRDTDEFSREKLTTNERSF